MPSIQAIADALSTTFTDERYPVGTLYVQTDNQVKSNLTGVSELYTEANWLGKGERTWIFIKAASAIAAGDLVGYSAGSDPFAGAPTQVDAALPATLLGVADNAIASGSYGWVIARGVCVGDFTTATANQFVVSNGNAGAAGEVKTVAASSTAGVIGMALEAKAAIYANGAQAYINVL